MFINKLTILSDRHCLIPGVPTCKISENDKSKDDVRWSKVSGFVNAKAPCGDFSFDIVYK